MTRGAPDYGNLQKAGIVYRVDDLAELAARLGALSNYDRRGEVLLQDGFEGNLGQWAVTPSGTGANAATSTTNVLQGAQSVKLTTGSDASKTTTLARNMGVLLTGRVGVEMAFSPMDTLVDLVLSITTRDLVNIHNYQVRAYIASGVVKAGYAGLLVPVGPTTLFWTGQGKWNILKYVFDFNLATFARVILNGVEYSPGSAAPDAGLEAERVGIALTVQAVGTDASNHDVYVDNVIVTQNEP